MRISDRSSDVCSSDLPRLQGQGSRSGARVHALFLESRPRDDKRRQLMPQGITDRVAILGMGYSRFGERWDASAEDLMVEAYHEARAEGRKRGGTGKRGAVGVELGGRRSVKKKRNNV